MTVIPGNNSLLGVHQQYRNPQPESDTRRAFLALDLNVTYDGIRQSRGAFGDPCGGAIVMLEYKAAELSDCCRWLEVDLCIPHSTLGWTLIGGGRRRAQRVFWHQVSDVDLPPEVDARRLFEERRKERAGDTQGVGFLTGCALAEFVEKRRDRGKLSVRCIATVGLKNALRIGDLPPADSISPGTINILLQTSFPLSECGSLEALSLVVEARTVAVLEARTPSGVGNAIATGTGTDCIVVASPLSSGKDSEVCFAGKHTEFGHLIGASVYDAVSAGIRRPSARGGTTPSTATSAPSRRRPRAPDP